ncbi:rRNA maturation RNase YbeY [Oceanobacillus halotolerans]|uniref:rRNA maturation RNase YbeY n=1 Tax=Oceanobacillus halotolerans TaxID=2663380 RepID=UPI0013DC80D6|nr:rRNA maturation RNase YbeY [Oceanobacillus halotolerans]
MNVDFHDQTNTIESDYVDLLKRVLHFTAEKEDVSSNAELSVTLVTNNEIQTINRDYRGKDKPTDVISFALEEQVEEEVTIKGAEIPVALGDIIISVEKAKEQATDYGHSFKRELAFLAVHGFLHLLGYDHMTEDEEKQMFQKQETILGEFGIER